MKYTKFLIIFVLFSLVVALLISLIAYSCKKDKAMNESVVGKRISSFSNTGTHINIEFTDSTYIHFYSPDGSVIVNKGITNK